MSAYAQRVMAAVGRADRNGALDLATEALKAGDRHPLVLMLAAERVEEAGQLAQALELLREAAQSAPDEPELLRRLGLLLARQGLLHESRTALGQASTLMPDQPMILAALGSVCLALGALDDAQGVYRRLATLLPTQGEPLAALAAVAVRQGRRDEARTLAQRALALDPANLTAAQALARIDLEQGDAAAAEGRVTSLLERAGPRGEAAIGLLGLRADARDKLGRYDEAFADYVARNELLHRQTKPLLMREIAERRIDEARRLARHFQSHAALPSSPAPPRTDREPDAHIFVVGFPRSGTTLLEKALAGHDRIRTLPEIDCLGAVAADLLAPEGLERLGRLPEPELATRRARYFEAAAAAKGDLAGRVLVDKLPLHSVALPAIAQLFPDAQIILSLRDPRDVILSCIRRRFQMNAAMFELLRPADAVDYYDAVMTLMSLYRRVLPITLHEVRHEQLVSDFEGELGRVLEVAGLGWQPEVAAFEGRAASDTRTPSDLQLTRGLNSEGVQYWRHYARPMAEILPRLAPWVERYQYPP